jgi:NAD(P)-dependent dehydrogenase (short-subunit alcohol dehydrogenase family)
LLPKLEKTKGSRVVITSSNAHKMNAKIHFGDIDGKKSYSRLSRYNQSKLANALFMHELDRRLRATGSQVITTACHPGVAVTDLMRHMPGWSQSLMPLVSFLTNTPAQGAWATLAAAVGGDVESGQYFGPMGPGEWTGKAGLTRTTRQARDPELAGKLWNLSIEMTGVDPGI